MTENAVLVAFVSGAIASAWLAVTISRFWVRIYGWLLKAALVIGIGAMVAVALLAHGIVQ